MVPNCAKHHIFVTAYENFRIINLTLQKMKFYIKDFFSKCDQIRRFLRISSPLLKKSLLENLVLCVV